MFQPKEFHNEAMEAAINNALAGARERQPDRTYLGASRWGHHCERALGYEYHKSQRDEPDKPKFSPDIYRVFDMGHDGETRMAEYMRLAGFELQTEKPGGGQIGFTACDGKLGGHCDGIIHGGPGIEKTPLVWENKALNAKSWADTKARGVKESKPLYYAQVQTYIAYMELAGYIFTAINRNTGEIFVEVQYGLDARVAQDVSDAALRVIQSEHPEQLARCAAEVTDFRCKFCDFKSRCWTKKEVAIPSQFFRFKK